MELTNEKRPQPVEEWLEKKINDKTFKLGKTLDGETQDQGNTFKTFSHGVPIRRCVPLMFLAS